MSIVLDPRPAFSVFNNASATSTSATFSAYTMTPPISLSAGANGQLFSCAVDLTWSIPAQGAPTSWVIQRYKGSSTNGSARTINGTLTSYSDSSGLSLGTAYTWKIYGVVGSWTSTTTTSNSETLSIFCT